MRRIIGILTVCCLLVSATESFSQNISNKGKEFWVSYPFNWFFENGNSQEMVLYFSAEQDAVVTLTSYVYGNIWTRTYNVSAGSVVMSDFIPKNGTFDARLYDLAFPAGNGGQGMYPKAINVQSTTPIVVYAHYTGNATSGAAMLLPVEAYGYVYTTLNNTNLYGSNPSNTYFYVTAAYDDTRVEIIPKVLTRAELPGFAGGRPAGVPFTVTLNKGQSFQVIANTEPGDLSGSKIKSVPNSSGVCLPVAVFCGTSRTALSCAGPGGGSGDFIMQQCFPSQAWGKRYLTAPTSNQSGANVLATNIYRILVKDPTTQVYKNGSLMTGLVNGDYYQYNSGTADYITSDKPIMVAQYMSSTGGCPNTGGWGDPEMIYLSPIEQSIKRVGFFRNNRERIEANYLTLIVPSGGTGLSSLTIDGTPFASIPAGVKHSYPHPNLPGYTVIVRRWGGFALPPSPPPGQCIVQSDSAFTAITYGIGSVESYGYNAGAQVNNLNALSSIQNTLDPTTQEHPFTCINTPIKLSALMAYQPTRMEWKISTLGSVITPNTDVIDNAPASTGTVVVNGITYYKYTLPGTYSFNVADTFEIPIFSSHPSIENCNNTEEVKIYVIVKDRPRADFTVNHTRCTLDTAYISGITNTPDGYTLTGWNWTFPGPVTATGQNVQHVFAPGTHNILLSAVTSQGCASDTIKQITVHPKPTTSFVATPTALCEDGNITFTPTSNYAEPALLNGWYWDFGNATPVTAPSSAPQTQAYPDYGTFIVKHVVKYGNLCISDTAFQTVTIHSKPRPTFDYPVGCLPLSGVAQFTSTATSPDGAAITTHAWDFGDPNANAGNPNTSALQNPTHMYSAYGTYNITYSATTSNGCTKDTVVQVTFNVRPQLSFTPLTSVCENIATVSVANGSVTNGVPGSGIYKGPGTSAAGVFTPSVAGPGVHTIWYVFTSTAGCADSLQQTIQVHARPRANFTYPNGGCLPTTGLVQFTNTSTVADAQTLSYLWNFNDPNANAGNPNTSTLQDPTHNFIEGTYNINLQVTSSNGCVKDTTIQAIFSITPLLTYPALNAICENAAPVSVATATVTNGATGTGTYSGPGTTAAGMFDPAVAGPGNHSITYSFTTAGGCTATIQQNILVHGRPRPNFTFPATCLAATGLVNFTNTSTIPDAQTMTWAWNFNDPNANAGNPNTSTLQHPTHNYGEGTFPVVLTVTSSNGCVKDTTINATFKVTPSLNYPTLNPVCENVPALSIATAILTNPVTVNGTGTYSGPGTTAAGMFNPAIAGYGPHTITYSYTTTGGCTNTITQNILVHARPRPNFTFPATCLAATGLVNFTNTSTIPDAQTMTWAWNFNDPNANAGNPNTSTLQHPTHNYGEGTFPVVLTVTSSNGCVKDTTINATFKVTPSLNYPALNPVCENVPAFSIATATLTNPVTVNGTGTYSGPGTTAAGMFNPAIAGYGPHTITYSYTTTGGCTNTITQNILVHARPRANFTFSAGCLPVNGLAQFTNASTIPDAQTMTYLWNFNDPNANAGNPNTSTLQNPTHNYGEGTYNVNLQVTSSNGCVKDTTIAATFAVRPQLSFGPIAPVCQNPGAAPSSIASATVTNSVNGTGVYSGPGTNAAGMFDPNLVAAGQHTITYTFTSAGGCVATATATIDVYPRPTASFTMTNNGSVCLGNDVTFTNTSTIPSGTITTWNWNLGTSTATYTNGNPFNVSYPSATNYNIQLVTVSDRGCFSLPATATVSVRPIPVVNFSLPASVCMPGGNAVFTNQSSVADNSALSYAWDFGDASGTSTAANPNYVYAAGGSYVVTLTATSAFGCTAQNSKTLDDFFDKPVANFTVTPQELCQGVDNVFRDASTAPNSTLQSWKWDFKDNTTSTSQNPTKRFNTPGVYNVTLIVTNAVGCQSDPFPLPVTVHLQPKIEAGQSFVVPQGTIIQTTATANSSGLTFNWTPPTGLSDATVLRPTILANSDETYTLTATGDFGCTATDFITVKILKPVKVPNIFTPNGDNIHDKWMIPNLADYPGCTVEVFNRYGQQVYYSIGYGTPWDGTVKGKELPQGAYYYVIQLQNGFKPITGSVTIVR